MNQSQRTHSKFQSEEVIIMWRDYEEERYDDYNGMFPNATPDEIEDYVEDHIIDGFPKSEDISK